MTNPTHFRVLGFYSTTVEPDHVAFAEDAVRFFANLSIAENFTFAATTEWERLNDAELSDCAVVIWINHFPHTEAQRAAFERYMERGGAWLGLHVSDYNDRHTNWAWFVGLMGGAVFYTNNWPALPATLTIDTHAHPVTHDLPAEYIAPAEEWYMWKPSPRENPDVQVLATLCPSNYPLGTKDILTGGDVPVVWTNTKYRMLYVNMGHQSGVFAVEPQRRLFRNALLWLGRGNKETASV